MTKKYNSKEITKLCSYIPFVFSSVLTVRQTVISRTLPLAQQETSAATYTTVRELHPEING